jgi:hypothetical protein
MAARFSLLVWPEPIKGFQYIDRRRDHAAAAKVEKLFFDMSALDPERFVGVRPEGSTHYDPFRFTPEGQAVFREWYLDHHAELGEMEPGDPLKGHYHKYDGLFARLSLVHHLIRYVLDEPVEPTRVDHHTASAVRDFIDNYLRCHARKIYRHLGRGTAYHGAKKIGRWLAADRTIRSRDEQNSVVRMMRSGLQRLPVMLEGGEAGERRARRVRRQRQCHLYFARRVSSLSCADSSRSARSRDRRPTNNVSINIKVIAELLDTFAFILVTPKFLGDNDRASIQSFSLYVYNRIIHILRNRRYSFYSVLCICAFLMAYVLANVYSVLHMSFLTKPLLNSYMLTEIVAAILVLILIAAFMFIITTVILLLGLGMSYIGPFLAMRMFFVGASLFFIARFLSIWW